MTLCINPDIQFTDNVVGGPLYQGKLYFGLPNQDPKTNPKQPFADPGFTTPISATQTLTDAGKLPDFVYMDGPYSLTCDDQYGAQVFSIASFTDGGDQLRADLASTANGLGDALVATKRTVSNSVATTVHNVMEAMEYNVKAFFGVVGDGIADDTAAINKALQAGGVTRFPFPGKYKVSGPLYYKSGSKIVFDEGAYLAPVPIAQFTMLSLSGTPWGYAIFVNENWQASTQTDSHVRFEGVNCFPDSPFNGHVILSRKMFDVQIYGGVASNCADYNATLACQNVVVDRCWTVGMTNCSYDFWEGCSHAIVRDCFAINCNAGINWNATDTYNTANLAANNFQFLNNTIFGGPGAGIYVSPLTAGSTIDDGLIQGNYINQFLSAGGPGNVPNGIVVQRSSSVIISENTLDAIGANQFPILVTGDAFAGVSDNCQIINNKIINSAITGAAMIGAYGTNHLVSGNSAHNSTGSIGIVADSPTTVIINKTIIGATTQIVNQTTTGTPTTPALALRAETANYRWKLDQDLRVDGTVLQATATALVATGTNLASALSITARYNVFSTVAGGTGAALPATGALVLGRPLTVWNDGANALTLYARTGDTINGAASQSIAAAAKMVVVCVSANVWKIEST
jgi:hypothetical protein